jgi:uncharacterized protein (TIGR02145 family)
MCFICTDCKKDKQNQEQPFVQLYYFTDARDNNIYKYVKIGNQYWMAENLRFKPDSGLFAVYDHDTSYISEYGYFYDWYTACQVCPSGWHLPSRDEWVELLDYIGGEELAKGKLKEAGNKHWVSPNVGATNEFGFSALPGGTYFFYHDTCARMGYYANFWTALDNGHMTLIMLLNNNNSMGGLGAVSKLDQGGSHVRCVKD